MPKIRNTHGHATEDSLPESAGDRRRVPEFLTKTHEMLSCGEFSGIVSWTKHGDSFIVLDKDRFESEVLPSRFKHSKFGSFVRQLNMYSFRKLGDVNHWEYAHDHFLRHDTDRLRFIIRKTSRLHHSHVANGGNGIATSPAALPNPTTSSSLSSSSSSSSSTVALSNSSSTSSSTSSSSSFVEGAVDAMERRVEDVEEEIRELRESFARAEAEREEREMEREKELRELRGAVVSLAGVVGAYNGVDIFSMANDTVAREAIADITSLTPSSPSSSSSSEMHDGAAKHGVDMIDDDEDSSSSSSSPSSSSSSSFPPSPSFSTSSASSSASHSLSSPSPSSSPASNMSAAKGGGAHVPIIDVAEFGSLGHAHVSFPGGSSPSLGGNDDGFVPDMDLGLSGLSEASLMDVGAAMDEFCKSSKLGADVGDGSVGGAMDVNIVLDGALGDALGTALGVAWDHVPGGPPPGS